MTSLRSASGREPFSSNPFDPDDWTGEIEIVPEASELFADFSSRRIIKADINRLWILTTVTNTDGHPWLWPSQQSDFYGINPEPASKYLLLHNASYPSLVQGDWYAISSSAPVTLRWVIGRKMR